MLVSEENDRKPNLLGRQGIQVHPQYIEGHINQLLVDICNFFGVDILELRAHEFSSHSDPSFTRCRTLRHADIRDTVVGITDVKVEGIGRRGAPFLPSANRSSRNEFRGGRTTIRSVMTAGSFSSVPETEGKRSQR